MPPSQVPGDGLHLAYREWHGHLAEDPLVLLHGVTGSGEDWKSVAPGLPERRIIALDARGHGHSEWDPGEDYVTDSHFADVVVALSSLGIGRFAVAGFSMGGGIAMLLAAALPERVSSLVVVDSYPDPRMTPGSRRIASWVSSLDAGAGSFDPAIARQFRTNMAEGRERLDLWSVWESVQCPTLVVRGERSDVLTADMAAEMVRRQPLAQLQTIAGVAHGIPFAKPAELAAAIVGFLET